MAKEHWTERFDMQIARQTIAQRAVGMLKRSGLLSDVEAIDDRRIRVGLPDGFDAQTDPLGIARCVYRYDKIDALARVLRVGYTITSGSGDASDSVIVLFMS